MTRVPGSARWLVVAVVAAAILIGSTVPTTPTRSVRGPFGLLGVDTWLHGIAFAVFALTLGFALASTRLPDPLVVLAAVGITAGYGAGIEILQLAIPVRRFEVGDIVADAVGAVVATVSWRIVAHSRRRRPRDGP